MDSDVSRRRKARINHTTDDRPLGITMVLTADELQALGIDPHATDHVEYGIEDGKIHLAKPDREVSAQ